MKRERDYKKENILKSRPDKIKLRVARNKARQRAIREGKASVGDGTIVHHKANAPTKRNRSQDVVVVSRDKHNRLHTSKSKAKR